MYIKGSLKGREVGYKYRRQKRGKREKEEGMRILPDSNLRFTISRHGGDKQIIITTWNNKSNNKA